MRILTFSTLYPNASRPSQGLFVETRLRQLLSNSRVQAQVVAPVPWFPSAHPRYGRYAAFASVPKKERRHGIQVSHPRFVSLPKIGMTIAPLLLANAVQPVLERIAREGYKFDLIDAHYFYPDGVAAAILGKRLGVPVVITARGSDLTLLPRYILPRKMIQWAACNAAGLVTVCAALKQPLIALGVGLPAADGANVGHWHLHHALARLWADGRRRPHYHQVRRSWKRSDQDLGRT